MAMSGLFLFLGGCQREEVLHTQAETRSDFFNLDYLPYELKHLSTLENRDKTENESNLIFKEVIDSISKYDLRNNLIANFINTNGLPIWSFFKLIEDEIGGAFYTIPVFRSADQKVSGIISITKTPTKTYIKYTNRENILRDFVTNYRNRNNNEAYFNLSNLYYFESELNGYASPEVINTYNDYNHFISPIDDGSNIGGYFMRVCWLQVVYENNPTRKIPIPPLIGWIDIQSGIQTAPTLQDALSFLRDLLKGNEQANSDWTVIEEIKAYIVHVEDLISANPQSTLHIQTAKRVCEWVFVSYLDPIDYTFGLPSGNGGSNPNVWADTYEKNRYFYDRCSLIDPASNEPNDIGAYSHAVWSESDLEKCSNLQSLIQSCPTITKEQLISLMTILDMNSITKNEFKKFSVRCNKPGAADALNSFLICNNQTLNSPRSFNNYIANYTEIVAWMATHNNDLISTNIGNAALASLCLPQSNSNANPQGIGSGNDFKTLETAYCIKNLASLNDKDALLDFYNNTTLIDPCTGEEIDKDEIFSGLCTSGEMSLAGLNAALDGVDYITKEQKNKIENILDGIDLDINDLCEDGPEYELNSCEKLLLNRYPSAKMGLLASGYAAQQWTDFKFGYNGRNDCSDAFRHALLNALSTFYLGADIAKEFGDAHECDNTPDLHLEGEMDLHNNAMGRSIYNSLPKPNNGALPTHVISAEICERLENGDLKVFSVPSNNQSPLVPSNNCKCN